MSGQILMYSTYAQMQQAAYLVSYDVVRLA